jgi:hypothetical protein
VDGPRARVLAFRSQSECGKVRIVAARDRSVLAQALTPGSSMAPFFMAFIAGRSQQNGFFGSVGLRKQTCQVNFARESDLRLTEIFQIDIRVQVYLQERSWLYSTKSNSASRLSVPTRRR